MGLLRRQSLRNSPIRLTHTYITKQVTTSMQQYASNWHVLPSVQLYTLTINNYALIWALRPDRTQAVSRRLHTVEARVRSQNCPYDICNERGGRRAGISLGTSHFPYQLLFHQCPILIYGQGLVGTPIWDCSTIGLILTPLRITRHNVSDLWCGATF
jgi:hypothetical protein